MNKWLSKEEFRQHKTIQSVPVEARDLLWVYLDSLNKETRDIILSQSNWQERFLYVATDSTEHYGLLRVYTRTGIEKLWSAYIVSERWGEDVVELLNRLLSERKPYISIELAVTQAKIEVMTKAGMLLAYDRDGNCLIPNREYEQQGTEEDSGGD